MLHVTVATVPDGEPAGTGADATRAGWVGP
jgi:hypothetical protein